VIIGLVAGTARAAAPKVPDHIIFPVVGPVQYTDDFGAPRPGGAHQGNDLMSAKRSPAVAAESGTVKYWTTSKTAGCMLYLYGVSGTVYYYIHLNNDLTLKNDNRGKCVAGTAYAKGLKNGAKVMAGQVIGYVGDSGDANGLHAHLHFELHPNRKAAVDAYPWLQRATHLLFSAPRGAPFTLELRGTVVAVSDDSVQLRATVVSAWPMKQTQTKLGRKLLVTVPTDATIQRVTRPGGVGTKTELSAAHAGEAVDLWTSVAPTTLKAQRGDDRALTASLISLVSP
jgi:hypothetical protein